MHHANSHFHSYAAFWANHSNSGFWTNHSNPSFWAIHSTAAFWENVCHANSHFHSNAAFWANHSIAALWTNHKIHHFGKSTALQHFGQMCAMRIATFIVMQHLGKSQYCSTLDKSQNPSFWEIHSTAAFWTNVRHANSHFHSNAAFWANHSKTAFWVNALSRKKQLTRLPSLSVLR